MLKKLRKKEEWIYYGLILFHDNITAIKLYDKLGWKVIGEYECHLIKLPKSEITSDILELNETKFLFRKTSDETIEEIWQKNFGNHFLRP